MTKILVVDDEKHIRDSCIKLLQRKRFEAEGAASGEEALEKVEKAVYDLVLLDIRMPGMDGIEVLRRAKKIVPDIVVLVLTGHGTLETASEAMSLGAAGFIRKPISIENLAETIDATLERVRKK
jgi:DNA-binding NtrC family response regulator